MSLLTLIIALVVVGVVLYAINRWVPMQPQIKTILNIVVVLIVVVWLLQSSGILGHLGRVRIHC